MRGEVRLHLHDRESTLLHQGGAVTMIAPDGTRSEIQLRTRPGAGGRVLGRVQGVRSPEAARELMEHEIVVPRQALPDLDEDEYYHRDLLGLLVVDQAGQELGKLAEIHSTGPVDVYTVRGGGEERYVPATADHIVEIDVPGGRMVVRA